MKMNIALISPAEASISNALFLDVREPEEHAQGHIASSVLLPLAQVDPTVVGRMLRGERRCIVVCKGGTRALKAAQMLGGAGIPNLSVLEGGIDAWTAAGLPIKAGSGGVSIQSQTRTIAGCMVLAGALLGIFVDRNWTYLAAFAGCGLIVAGLTGWCGMSVLLSKMPWNRNKACTCSR
jgi:rhodanese-related sulfurtransferase